MARDIERNILAYHRLLTRDRHHRFRSWGHCYRYFRNARKEDFGIDHAAVHLGFYLASWGMYRGTSFLLWKDYKIHKYAIREILMKKYMDLWHLDITSPRINDKIFRKLMSLIEEMKNIYSVNRLSKNAPITDTLVSKILLGTMACTPAYDRFVVKGMREESIPCGSINERHFHTLRDFCVAHSSEFRRVRKKIRENGMRYPMMKLVDMYFWEKGRSLELEKV